MCACVSVSFCVSLCFTLSVFACMCMCIYECVLACMHVGVCARACVCVHACMCACVCVCGWVRECVCVIPQGEPTRRFRVGDVAAQQTSAGLASKSILRREALFPYSDAIHL